MTPTPLLRCPHRYYPIRRATAAPTPASCCRNVAPPLLTVPHMYLPPFLATPGLPVPSHTTHRSLLQASFPYVSVFAFLTPSSPLSAS